MHVGTTVTHISDYMHVQPAVQGAASSYLIAKLARFQLERIASNELRPTGAQKLLAGGLILDFSAIVYKFPLL